MTLRDQRLTFVRKELDQIGVAVSVVGTSHTMLNRLHGYGEELADSLHGTREPVRKLQGDFTRALHNLKRANPRDSKRSSKAIWAVRDLADRLIKLRRKVKDVEPEVKLGRLRLDNVYGYTERELRPAEKVVREAVELMGDWGLYRKVVYGDIILDPEDSRGKLAAYLAGLDAIAVDPDRWPQGVAPVLGAFADRLWVQVLKGPQHEVWGQGVAGWDRFRSAFVAALDGGSLSADTSARLAVTMTKVTNSRRWMP